MRSRIYVLACPGVVGGQARPVHPRDACGLGESMDQPPLPKRGSPLGTGHTNEIAEKLLPFQGGECHWDSCTTQRSLITRVRSSTPAFYAEACEAIRLAIGEPTRVTAKLAYPSSEMGG